MNQQVLTHQSRLVFFIILLNFTVAQANIFKTEVISKSGEIFNNVGVQGSYVINGNLQTFDKNIDTDNDGDLDIVRVKSNQDSSVLSITLLINDGNNVYSESSQEFLQINLPSQTNIELIDVYVNDLNNDGLLDIWFYTKSIVAACDFSVETSYIYKNNGSNQFELAQSFYYEAYQNEYGGAGKVASIEFVDLNNDSFLDSVVDNLHFHTLTPAKIKLINNHNFDFNLKPESMLPYVTGLKTLDFNNDGNQDFITLSSIPKRCNIQTAADNLANKIHGLLWQGDGNGAFTAHNQQIFNLTTTYVAAQDINNDTFTDVLLTQINTEGEPQSTLYFGDDQDSYANRFTFSDALSLVQFADMDNDGLIDIVALTAGIDSQLIIYKNLGADQFGMIHAFPFAHEDGELFLEDMDKDGRMDMVINSKLNEDNTHVYFNNGEWNFADLVIKDVEASTIGITDFDFDGYPDILANASTHLKVNPIFKNTANRSFVEISYDDTFLNFGLKRRINYHFQSMIFVDMDNDGRDDFFGISREFVDIYNFFKIRVLMHDDNSQIKYHNNTDVMAQFYNHNVYKKNDAVIDFADFNNDGLKDIVVVGDDEIKVLTQTKNPVIEDIYFDPLHVGHGYSIENVGRDNLYYTLFYTYDDTGNSEWYLQLNRMLAKQQGIKLYSPPPPYPLKSSLGNLINYNYDYFTQSTYPNNNEEKMGFIENNSENDANDSISLDFIINSSNKNIWDLQRLIGNNSKPNNDFSGLWWAGIDDSGWGLSLNFVQRTDRVDVFAILFFYDAEGNARWLLGHAEDFVSSRAINLQMEMFNGYGRELSAAELTTVPAGNITLTLHEASQDLSRSGIMSMNVFYPKGSRRDWVRDDVPFALFSKPRIEN